jgi:hypothetical protein
MRRSAPAWRRDCAARRVDGADNGSARPRGWGCHGRGLGIACHGAGLGRGLGISQIRRAAAERSVITTGARGRVGQGAPGFGSRRLRPARAGGRRPQPARSRPAHRMAGDRYEKRLSMKTDRLHGNVIARMSAYHDFDHELVTAGTEVPVYRREGSGWPADELASQGAGDDDELTDGLVCLPGPGTWEAAREEVAAALARTTIAGAAELTVDQPCPGTVVLTGAARTRSDRDLATATAWTADGITAVDDCIDIEC